MKKIVLLILTALCWPAISDAQLEASTLLRVRFGLGISNFLGELGGANQIGYKLLRSGMVPYTDGCLCWSPYKLSNVSRWNHISPMVVFQETINHHKSISGITETWISSLTFTIQSQLRRSLPAEQVGHRYRLRKSVEWEDTNVYLCLRRCPEYFISTKNYLQGTTIRLQPLGTEGQGLIPSA